MKKISLIMALAAMLLVFLVPVVYADDSTSPASAATTSTGTSQVFKASDIMGADVKNLQGESLGKISDLAVNPQGNVVFALVSRGETGKLTPVPITAMKIEENGKVMRLDISASKLDTAPSFSGTDWPGMMSSKWTADTYKFYGVSPAFNEGGSSTIMENKEKEMEKNEMQKIEPKY